MRKVTFAAVLALLALAACVTEAPPEGERRGPEAPAAATLDPARAADRQLLAYGEANPECRMWTNWEKLCSRTGPGGSVHCNTDPDRQVEPSAPFCANSNRLRPADWPLAEQGSRERFCVARREPAPPLDGRQPDATLVCARYDPERPFNGRRVAALIRPGCDGLSDAESGRPLCVRGGDPRAGIPDCTALAASGYESDRLLVCGRWTGPAACHAYPVHEPRPPEEGEITFGAPDPNRAPVHGIACENH